MKGLETMVLTLLVIAVLVQQLLIVFLLIGFHRMWLETSHMRRFIRHLGYVSPHDAVIFDSAEHEVPLG